MNGFFLVNKPKGLTSFDVCHKIKRKFNLNKCGHNGTLDPNTTGLMVVACDQSTKLLKLLFEHDKTYEAKIIFGYDSTTLDMDGTITKDIMMNFTKKELIEACEKLAKEEEQIPPLTSSIKVDGKKLMDYQRQNIEVEIPKRNVKIYDYTILNDPIMINNHIEFSIRLHVSKGFYVRSFARDLGKLLNGCAILKELNRIKAGQFSLQMATDLDELTINDLKPIDSIFNFPKVEVDDYIASLVKNGVILDNRQTTLNEPFYVINNCDIIAIYEVYKPQIYKPLLIFK